MCVTGNQINTLTSVASSNSTYGTFFEGGGLRYAKIAEKIAPSPKYCCNWRKNGAEKLNLQKAFHKWNC